MTECVFSCKISICDAVKPVPTDIYLKDNLYIKDPFSSPK